MKRLLYALPLLALVGIAILGGSRLLMGRGPDRFEVTAALPAPDAVLPALAEGGEPLVLSALPQTPALVNIWASWCAPCKLEHPVLIDMAARGVPIYGVLYKDTPEAGRQVLADDGNPFLAVGQDPSGRVALSMGLSGVPDTYLIGTDGTIICRRSGVIEPQEAALIAADITAICSAPGG
jgi:cytochrome c biogenesis protein CcmG/thiol:disulfide interchange protein DsbE